MTWTVRWSFVAERHDLFLLHWETAARACQAILHFAATGRGAEQHEGNPRQRRIRVTGAVVYLHLDPIERVVHVVRVYRRE